MDADMDVDDVDDVFMTSLIATGKDTRFERLRPLLDCDCVVVDADVEVVGAVVPSASIAARFAGLASAIRFAFRRSVMSIMSVSSLWVWFFPSSSEYFSSISVCLILLIALNMRS